ncbi:hypothetical protein BH09CHL1_BH09CHL1_37190 [soil metagenome]
MPSFSLRKRTFPDWHEIVSIMERALLEREGGHKPLPYADVLFDQRRVARNG